MIDANSMALTATFMTNGLRSTEEAHRKMGPDGRYSYDMYSVWEQGGLELHAYLVEFAELSEKVCDLVRSEGEYDFPGVYDYEVSEPFGMHFGEQLFKHGATLNDNVNKQALADYLVREIAVFFSQCEDDALFQAGVLYNKIKVNL